MPDGSGLETRQGWRKKGTHRSQIVCLDWALSHRWGRMTGNVMKTGKFEWLGFKTPGFRVRGLMQLESGVSETEITMPASWGP